MKIAFALACSCLLACNSTTAPGPATRPEPATAPGPATTPEPATTPAPATVPAPAAVPAPPPAHEPPRQAVREAGVPAPASKPILALARAAKLAAPALATAPEAFGPRRHAAILRTRTGAAPAKFGLHAVLLTLPEAAGADWTITSTIDLSSWSRPWYEDSDPEAGSIPTTIKVDDLDDDGELELQVRFRSEIMCGGGGENQVTTLMIVELGESPPRIALQTEIDHALGNGAVQTRTRVIHEDLDQDGHRDLKIEYRTSEEGAPPVEEQRRWRWDPGADTWARLTTDGTWQEYKHKDGCDW